MKILVLHNRYLHRGGEDTVFETETRMLEDAGHTVLRYEVSNDIVGKMNPVTVAAKSIWNRASYKEIRTLIRHNRPDVAHFHNTTFLISPAGYWACKSEEVPVVQTLHNYRLACLNALLYRDNAVCEDCLGHNLLRGIYHRCYRSSLGASSVLAATVHFHRLVKTYRDKVDIYIALTEFAKAKMIEAGLPAEKIVVKANAVDVPSSMPTSEHLPIALFAGRLSQEKGVDVLIKAWKQANLPSEVRLHIAGDGPERVQLETLANGFPTIRFVGKLSKDDMQRAMGEASVSILPSMWYEGFPMTIAEGFACGLPAIVSGIGGLASLVRDGETGFHFQVGNAESLANTLERAFAAPERLAIMGRAAYEYIAASDSPPERNVRKLLAIYEQAIAE